MSNYEESKKEVEKFIGQGQSQFVSLIEMIEAQEKRIASLESDLDQLRELLKQLSDLGPNNEREFRGWEISRPLMEWANGEESD